MSTLTDIGTDIGKGIDSIKGWAEELAKHVPSILETATKYENSPIVQALEGLVLPPHIEAEIANLIKIAAEEYSTLVNQQNSTPADGDTTTADASTTTPATT